MTSRIARATQAEIAKWDVARDTQLCLETAAFLAFPDRTVSAATLRAEAARGKLAIFRIGKKYYTTLEAIEKMVVEKCRVAPKEPASICEEGMNASRNGPSETEGMKSARAALQASVKMLKSNSRHISPPSTGQTSATVIRPKFPSRTSSRSTPRKERQ